MDEARLIGISPIALSVVSFIISALLTKLFYNLAQNTQLMDKPNDRSLHARPIVRGGGLVFIGLSVLILPILCYFTKTPLSEQSVLIVSIILLATVSFFR